MSARLQPTLLIGCGALEREIRFLAERNHWDLDLQLRPPLQHLDPAELERGFREQVAQSRGRDTRVFFGACHPGLDGWLAERKLVRIPGSSCTEMLLGPERFAKEQARGTYVLTESAATAWGQALKPSASPRADLVRDANLGVNRRMLAVRTPCSKDFTAAAEAAAASMGLPLEWLDVDLGHLERTLATLLAAEPPASAVNGEPSAGSPLVMALRPTDPGSPLSGSDRLQPLATPVPLPPPSAPSTSLEARFARLARDKSFLELIVRLMGRVSAASEVEPLASEIVAGMMSVLGGTNVTLVWRSGARYELLDLLGRRESLATLDDAEIEQVFASGAALEHATAAAPPRMYGMPVQPTYTWVVPLVAGADTVAVMRMDDVGLSMAELQSYLPTVFAHAALAMKDAQRSADRFARVNARLEAEVSGREKAEQANAAKSQFLASVSHEIRTPLNGIIGIVQLFRGTSMSDEQKHYLESMEISSEALLGVINDVLDLSKIEAGHMDIAHRPFSPRRLAKHVIESLEGRMSARGLEGTLVLANELAPALWGDELRLGQVLLNLVGNAVKFTEKGGITLRVEVVSATAGRQHVRFSVEDTGIGIPLAAQQRVFEAFEQVDGTLTRRRGGTGLGLPICKRLVGLMGGRLWVESTPGVGSAFRFEVPLDVAPASAVEASIEEETSTLHRPMRLLVAEDNPVNERVVVGLLTRARGTAVVTHNGVEALAHAFDEPWDAVLMDVEMPEMDGVEATRRIREHEKESGGHLPIIAVTAHALAEQHAAFLAAGFDGCVTKPVRLPVLVAEIERLAKR